MKFEVRLFIFFKITLYYTMSSSKDLTIIKYPEKYELTEGSKVNYNQNISPWFRNSNLTCRSNNCIKSTLKIGKSCFQDRDCEWHDNKILKCIYPKMNKKKGKCRCPEGSKFDIKSLSCTKLRFIRNPYAGCENCRNKNEFFFNGSCVSGNGAKCSENSDCHANNSFCDKGICRCSLGYEYINQSYCEYNQCVKNFIVTCNPELKNPCCDKTMKCINITPERRNGSDYKCVQPNQLGENCDNNLDCISIPGAKCSENNTCVCKINAIEYNNICLKTDYDYLLAADYEMFYYPDKDVYRRKLDPKLSHFRTSRESKTVYGEECTEDIDCNNEDYQNLLCAVISEEYKLTKYCKCKSGTKYDHNLKMCTKERHESLMEEIELRRINRYKMLINGTLVSIYGGECKNNFDCYHLKNGICSERKVCECKPGWRAQNQTSCFFDFGPIRNRCNFMMIPCSSKEDCFVENSICNKSYCDCREEDYFDNKMCISRERGVNTSCQCEQSCKGLKYGKCVNNICKCEENYKEKDGKCAGKHGALCDTPEDCYANNAVCRKRRCECQDNFDPSGDDCVEHPINLNSSCLSNETCLTIKNSKCKDRKCQCDDDHREKDGQCLALFHIGCNLNEDCYLKSSICIDKICACPDTHYLKDDNCYEKTKRINDTCYSEEACQDINYTSCIDNKCLCRENYLNVNKSCQALIAENCTNNPLSCHSGTCQCPNSFYFENGCCFHNDDSLCIRENDWFCKLKTASTSFFAFKKKFIDVKEKVISKVFNLFNYFTKNDKSR